MHRSLSLLYAVVYKEVKWFLPLLKAKTGHLYKFQRFLQGKVQKFVNFSVVYIRIFRYTMGGLGSLARVGQINLNN